MKAPDESAGQDTVCRKCQEPLKIPASAGEPSTGVVGRQLVWVLAMLVSWGAGLGCIAYAFNTSNLLERLCILTAGILAVLAGYVTACAVDRIGGQR